MIADRRALLSSNDSGFQKKLHNILLALNDLASFLIDSDISAGIHVEAHLDGPDNTGPSICEGKG